MASFNTTVRQMTEVLQRPKCLSEKKQNKYKWERKVKQFWSNSAQG